MTTHEEHGDIDNCLLEHRMALELRTLGLIDKIFPIMVGKEIADGEYSDFFASKLRPYPPPIKIKKLEEALKKNFEKLQMDFDEEGEDGESRHLEAVMDNIFKQQGGFIRGEYNQAVHDISYSIHEMCHGQAAAAAKDGKAAKSEEELRAEELLKLKKDNDRLSKEVEKYEKLFPEGVDEEFSSHVGVRGLQEMAKAAKDGKVGLLPTGYMQHESEEVMSLTKSLNAATQEIKTLQDQVKPILFL